METLSVTGNPSPGGPGGSPRPAPLTDRRAPLGGRPETRRRLSKAGEEVRAGLGLAAAVIDGADAGNKEGAGSGWGGGGGRRGSARRRKEGGS